MMGLEPEYFNSALMKKLDVLLQDGLGPVVARLLRDELGNDWTEPFNQYLASKRTSPINKAGGDPTWDFNHVMHGVVFYANKSRHGSADEEKKLANELRWLRNDMAHARPDDIGTRASIERTFEFLRKTEKILKAFGVAAQHREAVALLDRYEKDLGAGMGASRGTDADPVPAFPGTAPISDPQGAANAVRHDLEAAGSLSPSPAPPIRSTPLPEPAAGVTWFPVIGEGISGFAYFRASRLSDDKLDGQTNLAGLPQGKKEEFQRVLDATRAGEEDDSWSGWRVRFRMDPTDFSGPSFGLAAAIADRSARYGYSPACDGITVIATGSVLPQQQGRLGTIDRFADKVVLVDTSPDLRSGARVLFVFPKGNYDEADSGTRDILSRWSAGNRIAWRAVEHLNELNDLFDMEAVARPAAAPAETTGQSAPGRTPEVADETAHDEAPPLIKSGRAWLSKRVAAGIGLGLVVIAGLAGASVWVLNSGVDRAAQTASDERLDALIGLAAEVEAYVTDESRCVALGHTAKSLTPYDATRMTASAEDAKATATECSLRFAASDSRIAALRQSASAIATGTGSLDALAEATGNLTSFDLARSYDAETREALASGKKAIAAIDASKTRLTRLVVEWTRFSADQTLSDLNLAQALGAITAGDQQRATPSQWAVIAAASSHFSRAQAATSPSSDTAEPASVFAAPSAAGQASPIVDTGLQNSTEDSFAVAPAIEATSNPIVVVK